jgi:RES domain
LIEGNSHSLMGAPPHGELRRFPTERALEGAQVWRVTGKQWRPWHFGDRNRFGIRAPLGTCYVSNSAITAIAETVVRGSLAIQIGELRGRSIRDLRLPRDFTLANFTSRRSARWGVTRELGAEYPYDRCREWAEALATAGYQGISYWARHDVSDQGKSIALFAEAGAHPNWLVGRAETLSSQKWLKLIESELDIAILPDRASELDLEVVKSLPVDD